MKKLLLIASLLLLPLAAQAGSHHQANDGKYYLRIDSGYSWSHDASKDFNEDVDDSFIFGGGVGYRIDDRWRTDLTVSHRGGYDVDYSTVIATTPYGAEADVSSTTGLVNIYYDFEQMHGFTPYLGAGIGYSRNKVEDASYSVGGAPAGTVNSETKGSFAWQLSAGAAIDICENWQLDIGYRYMDMGTAETSDSGVIGGSPATGLTTKGHLHASEIQAGLRYSF